MIQSTNFALFPSEELYSFTKKSVILIDEKKTTVTAVEPFLSISKARLEDFKNALDREAKNPLVKIRTQKATDQIDAFMALRKQAESASTRKKAGVAEAATVIIDVIRKYGWTLQRFGQKTRLTQLDGLISELKTKHPAEVALIGATELLEELEQAQADYLEADTNVVRSENNSTEPTVTETRQPLTDSVKQLFQIISLQEVSAPSAGVTALIASLNELITTSLATVKASDTRTENAKKNAATATTTVNN
ncbi:MAG: DUF6261 family protein [Paludibacter sp.]|nr:DUF6261 family protein [Paludibacter sp.]